jgi:hypothetical protein
MRRLVISLCLILPFFSSGVAQTPNNEQQLLALIKEVQTQQAQIADNQAKIDAKLAEVAETIRVARLFVGKIGK